MMYGNMNVQFKNINITAIKSKKINFGNVCYCSV